MKNLCRAAALAAVAAMAALPSAAQAAKTVYMGVPPADRSKFAETVDVLQYFPKTITVKRNATVSFVPAGFHNADIPGKGQDPLQALAPSGTASGANDAAGQAFWFNGQPLLGFAPEMAQLQYGKTVRYSGAKRVQSGLPFGEKLKPFKVKFTKSGSYSYYCSIHPGMKGRVKVRSTGKGVPSERADKRSVSSQVKKALAVSKSFDTDSAPAGTINVGLAKSGVEYFGFAPSSLNVAVGSTVAFNFPTGSGEVHNAATGPGDAEKERDSYLGKLAASFEAPVFDPIAVYPSEQPGTVANLTPSLHGNGFWNSGLMDATAATPLPQSNSVKFAAAGTYTFFCLIHPFMKATVTAS